MYKKINLAITDLPPKSAIKVFEFVNKLFENDFELDMFIKRIEKFTTQEQYFICFYLNQYFITPTKNSFYPKWIENQEEQHIKNGNEYLFAKYSERINHLKLQLQNEILNKLKTFERRSNVYFNRKVYQCFTPKVYHFT